MLPTCNPVQSSALGKPTIKFLDTTAIDCVQQQLLNREILVSGGELLSISSELVKRIHNGTTVKHVVIHDLAMDANKAINKMVAKLHNRPPYLTAVAVLRELQQHIQTR